MNEDDKKCANCRNYVDNTNEKDYCLDCWDAYTSGYEQARFELEQEGK